VGHGETSTAEDGEGWTVLIYATKGPREGFDVRIVARAHADNGGGELGLAIIVGENAQHTWTTRRRWM
jgi:hypothetical protein